MLKIDNRRAKTLIVLIEPPRIWKTFGELSITKLA